VLSRDDSSVRFLKLILPVEGDWLFVAAIKRSKGLHHVFVQTIDELWSTIEEADRDGYTVYHACAVFRDNTGRKQINAAGAKALWLDIDAGKEKFTRIKSPRLTFWPISVAQLRCQRRSSSRAAMASMYIGHFRLCSIP
jgi:hypothetical protein